MNQIEDKDLDTWMTFMIILAVLALLLNNYAQNPEGGAFDLIALVEKMKAFIEQGTEVAIRKMNQ